jgi:hypothetical protein
VITKPDLYSMDAETYHRDPLREQGGSVSSTTLKILHEQSAEHARHYIDHGRPPKRHFDLGSAVHADALGRGAEVVYWGEGKGRDSWRSDDAKAFYKAAQDARQIPLMLDEKPQVEAMVAAIRRHRILGPMLEPGKFTAEQAAFWIDPGTGLWCRGMWDAVPDFDDVMTILDLKTARSASPESIAKAIADYRYDMQGEHYTDAARVLGLAERVRFLLAFVEKEAPHSITVRPIGEETRRWAAQHRREALNTYAQCVASGHWPGYDDPGPDDELEPIEAPYWKRRQWEYAADAWAGLESIPREELF